MENLQGLNSRAEGTNAMGDLLMFAFLNFLGVMSPGPDFAIVLRFGLTGSRKAALLATLGITCALLIHVFYCMSGIAFFLQNTPTVLRAIRLIGALYLGYLGLSMIFEKSLGKTVDQKVSHQAFWAGFLTNLFNPKATILLLSLFTQFAHSYTTWPMKLSFALCIPLLSISWFSFLSCSLTHPTFLPQLQRHQRRFTFLMGIILTLFAGVVLVSECASWLKS
jgi:threonine/homoserine/homoserine lactone efflux protein